MKKNIKNIVISAASLIIFLVLWELITDVFHVVSQYSLPSPIKVFDAFVLKLTSPTPEGSTLFVHIGQSLKIAILGFLAGTVIGVPLGIMMAWNRKFEMLSKPIFDFVRNVPPVGWIPLMILLLGIGTTAKVAIVFFVSFIPAVINSYSGIRQTNEIHLWTAKTFGATNSQLLFKVAIPSALPFIFTGLKIAMTISWMALVAAELLAATKGLGYLIQVSRTIGRPDIVIVGMLTIGVIGAFITAALEFFERIFIKGRF